MTTINKGFKEQFDKQLQQEYERGKKEAQKEFLDLLNWYYNNYLSSLDSQFCKDEKDIIEKNFALKLIDRIKQSLGEKA